MSRLKLKVNNCLLNNKEFLKLLNFIFFFGKFWPPTDGISTPLPMEYRPPYPWYIDPSTHGILTPLSMVYRPPYPWYIDPPTHGISTPQPMVFWPPYLWYIKPSLMVLWTPPSLLIEMRGGSIYHEGVQNTMTKIYPWVKISYVNWPRGQFTMGFKIPYDTGTTYIFLLFRWCKFD